MFPVIPFRILSEFLEFLSILSRVARVVFTFPASLNVCLQFCAQQKSELSRGTLHPPLTDHSLGCCAWRSVDPRNLSAVHKEEEVAIWLIKVKSGDQQH